MRLIFIATITLLLALGVFSIHQQIEINGQLIDVTGVPLYDYIGADDGHFSWEEIGTPKDSPSDEVVIHYVKFTSQQWLNENTVDRSLWTHHMKIIRPYTNERPDFAALYVTGGRNRDDDEVPYDHDQDDIVGMMLAKELHATVAVLYQVPNQRTVFKDDPDLKGRSEDDLVGYTWKHYIDDPSRPDWIAYFPMVKTAVKALDVLEEISLEKTRKGEWRSPLTRFYMAGASKRGATTWFASAYEGYSRHQPRLIGSAPIVYDTLNFTQSVPRMYELLGGWTFAFTDYYDKGITEYVGLPEMHTLAEQVDPLASHYASGLEKIPKLVVTAPGDEFFVLDNDKFFWDSLPGDNYRAVIPNAEHALITNISEVVKAIAGHVTALYYNYPMPLMHWATNPYNGQLRFYSQDRPSTVKLYWAETNPSVPLRRDFRLIKRNIEGGCLPPAVPFNEKMCVNPVLWTAIEVNPVWDSTTRQWVYSYTPPQNLVEKWHGYYFVAEYNVGQPHHQWYSTQVSIYPDTLPFPPCGSGSQCRGELV